MAARRRYSRWSDDDVKRLYQLSIDTPDEKIAEILGKTIRAVRDKRFQLRERGEWEERGEWA